MKIEDFIEVKNGQWCSKERFLFKNDVVEFYYHWVVDIFHYQPGWSYYNTKYTITILVDKESRCEMHKNPTDFIDDILYSFTIKVEEFINKDYNEKDFQKILKQIDKLKIEPKIKKDKYEKIKAILNGGHFNV